MLRTPFAPPSHGTDPAAPRGYGFGNNAKKHLTGKGVSRYLNPMYEICFTIIDLEGHSATLAGLDGRLQACLSARGCQGLVLDCSLPGKIFAIGHLCDEEHAVAAANHLAACVGRQCPVIVEVSELGTANHILRKTIIDPAAGSLQAAE